MKTKVLFFIGISTIVTLSFTFITNSNKTEKALPEYSVKNIQREPIGGFISEDKF